MPSLKCPKKWSGIEIAANGEKRVLFAISSFDFRL